MEGAGGSVQFSAQVLKQNSLLLALLLRVVHFNFGSDKGCSDRVKQGKLVLGVLEAQSQLFAQRFLELEVCFSSD